MAGIYHHHFTEVEAHQGQCVGGDEEFGLLCRNLGFKVIGHPPTNKKLISNFVPDLLLPEKDYLPRNEDIVDVSHFLIAAPQQDREVLRSGTWSTVRYARKVRKPIIYLLPGIS